MGKQNRAGIPNHPQIGTRPRKRTDCDDTNNTSFSRSTQKKREREKKMTLTQEQGRQWAKDFFAAFQAGFTTNTHGDTLKPFLAETMSWDWSDGFSGTNEPSSKVTEQLAQTWGFMVEKVIADPIVLVSTTDDRIEMFSPNFVIQINGGLPQSHVVGQPVSFSMTVKDGKP